MRMAELHGRSAPRQLLSYLSSSIIGACYETHCTSARMHYYNAENEVSLQFVAVRAVNDLTRKASLRSDPRQENELLGKEAAASTMRSCSSLAQILAGRMGRAEDVTNKNIACLRVSIRAAHITRRLIRRHDEQSDHHIGSGHRGAKLPNRLCLFRRTVRP